MNKGNGIGRWHLITGVMAVGAFALSLSYQSATADVPKDNASIGISAKGANITPRTHEEELEAKMPWYTPDSAVPLSAEMFSDGMGITSQGGVASAVACSCHEDCATGNQCTRGNCTGRKCFGGTLDNVNCDDYDDQISCGNAGGVCAGHSTREGTCITSNLSGGTICDNDGVFCQRDECVGGVCGDAMTDRCTHDTTIACNNTPECAALMLGSTCTTIPAPRCLGTLPTGQTCDEANDSCLVITGPVGTQDKGRCCYNDAADAGNIAAGQQKCLAGATKTICDGIGGAGGPPRRWYPSGEASPCPCPRYSSGIGRPGTFGANTEPATSCGTVGNDGDHVSIGDDYVLTATSGIHAANTHLLLKRIRWVGGTDEGGEDNRVTFVLRDSSGVEIGRFGVALGQSGVFLYSIPLTIPFHIPPGGYLTVHSPFFFPSIVRWSQTTVGPDNDFVAGADPAVDVGTNSAAIVWLDNGSTAAANIVAPAATATGILAFELIGDPAPPPNGACCTGFGACTDTVPWLCVGKFQGIATTCAGSLAQCNTGACCRDADGNCDDDIASGACTGLDSFNGFGSFCDALFGRRDDVIVSTPSLPVPGWSCCEGEDLRTQPAANSCATAHIGHDNNEACTIAGSPFPCCTGPGTGTCAGAAVIRVPPVGSPKGLTFTDDNTGATQDGDQDWWFKFSIDDHADVTIDHCCSNPAIGPTFTQIFPDCPTGPARGATRSERGRTCHDENVTMTYNDLTPGTYYLRTASADGISRPVGGYSIHLTIEGLPRAACCKANVCQGVCGPAAGPNSWPTLTLCTPPDGSAGTCTGGNVCKLPNFNECDATQVKGHFKPNVAVCSTQCGLGSCCGPNPGECEDNGGAGVLPGVCVAGQNFVGGSVCVGDDGSTGHKNELVPCPICLIDRQTVNCQRDNSGGYGQSDRTTGLRKADDFVAQCTSIDQICWSGLYQNYVQQNPRGAGNLDCGCVGDSQGTCIAPGAVQVADRPFGNDDFEIRLYADDSTNPGLPGALLATRTQPVNPAAPVGNEFTAFVMNNLNVNDDPKPSWDTWEYTAVFPDITGLTLGGVYHLEITNDTPLNVGGPSNARDCNWSWYESGDGNSHSFSDGSPPYEPVDYSVTDNTFCVGINGLPCGIQEPPDRIGGCWACPPSTLCAITTLAQCIANNQNWLGVGTNCSPSFQPALPPNDLCTNPETVTLQVTRTDNRCALITPDGPQTMSPCPPQGNSVPVSADLWYSYTATCAGRLTASQCLSQSGGEYDAVIGIYGPIAAGPVLGCPQNSLNIGCNDDGCTGIFGPGNATAIVVLGDRYLVRVGGFGGEGNEFGLGFMELVCADVTCTTPGPPLAGTGTLNTAGGCISNAECNPAGTGATEGQCLGGICYTPKNRYIEFTPPAVPAGAGGIAFKVTLEALPGPTTCPQMPDYSYAEGDILWVGAPNATGVSNLVPAPVFQPTWSRCSLSRAACTGGPGQGTCPAGQGTCSLNLVTFTDCEVVPCSTLSVSVLSDVCPRSVIGSFSPSLSMNTASRPGNISGSNANLLTPADGVNSATFVDVGLLLERFKGLTTVPSSERPRCDLRGNVPNHGSGPIPPASNNIDFQDVSMAVDGFKGLAYNTIIGPINGPRSCHIPVCGDSILQAGETCDDGNDVNNDACPNDCTIP